MPSKLLVDLFQAYYDARKNKRGTLNAIKFEMNFEKEIFKLHEELVSQKYEISPSTCFISFQPVRREIFAGAFRDRVVHHLIFNYLNPFCERTFINDSYSCRKGKGTSYGVKRADHFIRSCSSNYKKDCHILKLDISGYFMSINKNILFQKVEGIVEKYKHEINFDREAFFWLIKKVIFHDPVKNCVVRGKREDWVGLPKSKSLFCAKENCGLPIGNLTSQLFGNIYLNDFDKFIKHKLNCKYYGRYVDDILIIHQDKLFLKSLVSLLDNYLNKNLLIRIHPKKIYLQHFSKGVIFLGRVIKPYRINIKNHIKGNMRRKMFKLKIFFENSESKEKKDIQKLISCLNSYLGILQSCSAHKLALKFADECSVLFLD